MNRDWDKFRRQQRVRKNGSEKLPGSVEPLTGPNARGYGTGSTRPAKRCPFCDRYIKERDWHEHRPGCQKASEAKVPCPPWIRSAAILAKWRELHSMERLKETRRALMLVREIIEIHAIEMSRSVSPMTAESRVRHCLRTLPSDKHPVAVELEARYDYCRHGQTTAEPGDVEIIRSETEKLDRLFEELTSGLTG